MSKFKTLIFISEGTILNEQAAERNALKQTLAAFQHEFSPAERLKYNNLQAQSKLLHFIERLDLLLKTFFPANLTLARICFWEKMKDQKQLNKDAVALIPQIASQVNLLLFSKEKRKIMTSRLAENDLLAYFTKCYVQEDFAQALPDKSVFHQLLNEQKLDASSSLIIGTDLTDEIQGAVNAAIPSLWLAPKKVKMPISPRPTLHLSKLSDLIFYLELS